MADTLIPETGNENPGPVLDPADNPVPATSKARSKVDVKWNSVLVTASRGQHPDAHPLQRGYFSNFPSSDGDKLAVNAIVHRPSGGGVTVERRENPGNELVILVLGLFEPGFHASKPFTDEEREAVEALIRSLKEEGSLADDAPVVCEFGVTGEGWQSRQPSPVMVVDAPDAAA